MGHRKEEQCHKDRSAGSYRRQAFIVRKTNSYTLRFCTEEWGVQKRQAETYLQRAREIIEADYSVERSDFLDTRLALPEEIIESSIRCKQKNNAIGALKLQAQLTELLEASKASDKKKPPWLTGACVRY